MDLKEHISYTYLRKKHPVVYNDPEFLRWVQANIAEIGSVIELPFVSTDVLYAYTGIMLGYAKEELERIQMDIDYILGVIGSKISFSGDWIMTWDEKSCIYLTNLMLTCLSENKKTRNAARKIMLSIFRHLPFGLRHFVVNSLYDDNRLKGVTGKETRKWMKDNMVESCDFSDINRLLYDTCAVFSIKDSDLARSPTLPDLLVQKIKAKSKDGYLLSHTVDAEYYMEELVKATASSDSNVRESARKLFVLIIDRISPDLRKYMVQYYLISLRAGKNNDVLIWIKDQFPELDLKDRNRPFKNLDCMVSSTLFYMSPVTKKYFGKSYNELIKLIKSAKGTNPYFFNNSTEGRAYMDKLIQTHISGNLKIRKSAKRLFLLLWHRSSPQLRKYVQSKYPHVPLKGERKTHLTEFLEEISSSL